MCSIRFQKRKISSACPRGSLPSSEAKIWKTGVRTPRRSKAGGPAAGALARVSKGVSPLVSAFRRKVRAERAPGFQRGFPFGFGSLSRNGSRFSWSPEAKRGAGRSVTGRKQGKTRGYPGKWENTGSG